MYCQLGFSLKIEMLKLGLARLATFPAPLGSVLEISARTHQISLTKLRFIRSFWGAERVWILNWFKSYDTKHKQFRFRGFVILFKRGKIYYMSPMFFRQYFKFQDQCDCPQMLPARKASLSLPQLLFSFLIKMFQMGDSCSHSIFSYSFWQMQPKPYLYLLLFMLELCNFELAIKADFIFLQNVLGIHPNTQAKLWICFSFKKRTAFKFKIHLEMTKKVYFTKYTLDLDFC